MIKLSFLILFLVLFSSKTYAADIHVETSGDSNVSVNSQSNGESTTCINGVCTTDGGESKSTVCINGKCTESSGDVDINENGGNTQVKIKNNTNSTSVTTSKSKTEVKVKTGTELVKDKNDASEAANQIKPKIEEARKSFIDIVKEILSNIFRF